MEHDACTLTEDAKKGCRRGDELREVQRLLVGWMMKLAKRSQCGCQNVTLSLYRLLSRFIATELLTRRILRRSAAGEKLRLTCGALMTCSSFALLHSSLHHAVARSAELRLAPFQV